MSFVLPYFTNKHVSKNLANDITITSKVLTDRLKKNYIANVNYYIKLKFHSKSCQHVLTCEAT